MNRSWLNALAVGLGACGHVAAEQPRPVLMDITAPHPPAVREQAPAPESNEPAEPFSASWQLEATAESPGTPQPEAWVDADACPAPFAGGGSEDFGTYHAFVDKALGLPAGPEQLAVLRIAPSFSPTRVLSVVRRPAGVYLLRSTRLTTHVWAQMMDEMRALQGPSIRLGERSQAEALARVVPSTVVRERKLSPSTAKLIVELWRSLLARAQVVKEVGVATGKLDGTLYDVWYRGAGARTHSPEKGSVLGDVVLATEHLERVIDGTSEDETAELEVARNLLQASLDRTRRKEPCLRRYTTQ